MRGRTRAGSKKGAGGLDGRRQCRVNVWPRRSVSVSSSRRSAPCSSPTHLQGQTRASRNHTGMWEELLGGWRRREAPKCAQLQHEHAPATPGVFARTNKSWKRTRARRKQAAQGTCAQWQEDSTKADARGQIRASRPSSSEGRRRIIKVRKPQLVRPGRESTPNTILTHTSSIVPECASGVSTRRGAVRTREARHGQHPHAPRDVRAGGPVWGSGRGVRALQGVNFEGAKKRF